MNTEETARRRHPAGDERPDKRSLHRVVAGIDLSASSRRVLARVAALPLSDGVVVKLVHVVSPLLSGKRGQAASRDAQEALSAAASSVAKKLPRTAKVHAVVRRGPAAAELSAQADQMKAELIVLGRGGRAVRDIFLGSTAERVMRRGRLPVLAVRIRPLGTYRRPVVATNTDAAAADVLKWAVRIVPAPGQRIPLVHAYDVPYHGLIYPSLSSDAGSALREEYRQKALHALAQQVATAMAQMKLPPRTAPSWRTEIHYGSARTLIRQAVAKTSCDLLVLGTHGYRGLAHALLGSVAGDVLRDVACDVLVVPPGTKRRRRK